MREELKIKVIAKTRQSLVKKIGDGDIAYLVKTRSPREKDKANKEIIDLLAKFFNVNQSSISIKKGAKSNIKTIVIIRD
jgi:uncharacterized protein YggU (UPF0235/DUF167 family)